MKSVIAQGATVSKAIDDALSKAGQPQEFFVKVLEEAQSGFLGFGSKKAKIALFFKKDEYSRKDTDVLPQNAYRDLFNNETLDKQVKSHKNEDANAVKDMPRSKSQGNRRFYRRQTSGDAKKENKSSNHKTQSRPKPQADGDKRSAKKTSGLRSSKTSDRPVKKVKPQDGAQESSRSEQRTQDQSEGRQVRRRRPSGSKPRNSSQRSGWRANRNNNAKKTDDSKN